MAPGARYRTTEELQAWCNEQSRRHIARMREDEIERLKMKTIAQIIGELADPIIEAARAKLSSAMGQIEQAQASCNAGRNPANGVAGREGDS